MTGGPLTSCVMGPRESPNLCSSMRAWALTNRSFSRATAAFGSSSTCAKSEDKSVAEGAMPRASSNIVASS